MKKQVININVDNFRHDVSAAFKDGNAGMVKDHKELLYTGIVTRECFEVLFSQNKKGGGTHFTCRTWDDKPRQRKAAPCFFPEGIGELRQLREASVQMGSSSSHISGSWGDNLAISLKADETE